ncbi:hypothetical protein OEIGOIKO_01023 [Streptomyces chrestomyceticus JCM 4735]|uniref:Nodulation protein S (NodS) n=1 Tax=Streptomyces chrestomyceticus JCM 4735 TaxID=1306181 RepID=A0A7U9KQ40_9ACTN|nr:hypothetical protein [Streptomyces chrestomyceticus]GCD33304.1 hypothetical protein OEIGOIKO_01023 [Streptomyces chrestomyceticus JCM 4735]
MIEIVVVLRVEDAVLDFLSVLTDPDPGAGPAAVVLADRGDVLPLPAGTPPAERLALLAPYVRSAEEDAASPGPDALAGLIRRAADGHSARVWTHSPADNRRSRGRVGRDTALACAGLTDAAGAAAVRVLTVRHAVGYSPFLQFVSDLDRPLDRAQIAAKLNFVNDAAPGLLDTPSPEFMVQTPRIPAAERFFVSDPVERERLFALLASLGDEAAAVTDPWEFATSPYEARRLDATAAWVGRHCPPGGKPLVEVGACEGALTARLAADGFSVYATEPNPRFRDRLDAAVRDTDAVRTGTEDLAELAKDGPEGAAYLLVEMLYYGQDLALLDDLPTGLLFLALEPEALEARLRPWLAASAVWHLVEETRLVAPRVEPVCGGRAYLSKRGSVGLVLRRTDG